MEKVINKITFDPPIKGYIGYAFPLGILFADSDRFLPWMYSHHNYIMMCGKKDFTEFNQSDNDWMHGKDGVFNKHTVILPKYILEKKHMVIEMITDLIENNCYIIAKPNEYYIPKRRAYGKRHFDHENMVYGFDKSEETFCLASYTEEGYYGGTEISFDDYITALRENEYDDFTLNIISPQNGFEPKFEPTRCKTLLEYYLSGVDKEYTLGNSDYYHGIDAEKNLYYYLEYVRSNNKIIDVRYFYYLWEHKKIMLDRIHYMLAAGCLEGESEEYEKYAEVVKKAEIARGLNLKYNLTKSETTLKRMQELVCLIVCIEEELLTKVMENIKA